MCEYARQWTLWAVALLLACTSGFAQDEPPTDLPPETTKEADPVQEDLLDRGTPRRARVVSCWRWPRPIMSGRPSTWTCATYRGVSARPTGRL